MENQPLSPTLQEFSSEKERNLRKAPGWDICWSGSCSRNEKEPDRHHRKALL